MKNTILYSLICLPLLITGCKKKGCTDAAATNYDNAAQKDDNSCVYPIEEAVPQLIIKLRFDSTQARLDNFGQPATIPNGNSAQSPIFHGMSAHYIELAPNQYTQLGDGDIIYKGEETTTGGSNAVDFSKAITKGNNEVFTSIPLSEITPNTYQWLRVSLTYQNYDIKYRYNSMNLTGRLASFVGFNTYISSYTIDNQNVVVNGNKLQGYWGFESVGQVLEGQSPSTTVPNPLSATSPVPPGSCVVTGDFDIPFTITGTETEDIELIISLSTNNSFEWSDVNANGVYEPAAGDTVVDMGLRGLEPIIQ
ncbi:MAG: hypothetical protein N4A35_14110 [Flavobacteriales bacterium]|jgi:hypothetical protein|nr:hypothetical protein [Flavobacteriales bacterium]